MKLSELFQRMSPMFKGLATPRETARELYGDVSSTYARRLVLYDRLRERASGQLHTAFHHTSHAFDTATWEELAFTYFRTHPWGSYDYQPAGAAFPAHLEQHGVAAWIVEVARLEWATHHASHAEMSSPEGDTIRLAPSVSVLRFEYDVLWWLEHHHDSPEPPPRRATSVVVWRAANGARRQVIDDVQRTILELASGPLFDPALVPAPEGITSRALRGFSNAGIVTGATTLIDELNDPNLPAGAVHTVGARLDRTFQLVEAVTVRWENGDLVVASPLANEVITSTHDVRIVAVADLFAMQSSVATAIEGGRLAGLTPCELVMIADALVAVGLLIPS